jgi:hypothetical protein
MNHRHEMPVNQSLRLQDQVRPRTRSVSVKTRWLVTASGLPDRALLMLEFRHDTAWRSLLFNYLEIHKTRGTSDVCFTLLCKILFLTFLALINI